MAKDLPTVTITGFDATLIRLEGRFSSELDKRVMNLQGSFIRSMDKAASQVFKAMAVDTSVGGIVARRVMGSHAGTPSFLVAEGANWEPLTPAYLKRKRRLSKGETKDKMAGQVRTSHFWEYTGALRKAFRNQSEKMARMSGNTQRYASVPLANNTYTSMLKTKPKDELFEPLRGARVTGANIGTRSKNYDFVYDEREVGPTVTYSGKHKSAGGLVPERYVKQMNRYIQFDVFHGYAQYIKDSIEGKASTSPEDYVAAVYAGKRVVGANNSRGVFNAQTNQFEEKLPMGIKLYYHRNGKKMQRQMIQPYMRYYFKRIMVPLANKLLKGQL